MHVNTHKTPYMQTQVISTCICPWDYIKLVHASPLAVGMVHIHPHSRNMVHPCMEQRPTGNTCSVYTCLYATLCTRFKKPPKSACVLHSGSCSHSKMNITTHTHQHYMYFTKADNSWTNVFCKVGTCLQWSLYQHTHQLLQLYLMQCMQNNTAGIHMLQS